MEPSNSAPSDLYPGKRFRLNESGGRIPASGGTINFEDEDGKQYQIRLPPQTRRGGITFKRVAPAAVSLPSNVFRILIHLKAQDDDGQPVDTFDPTMTVIAKYNEGDLGRVNNDPNRLRLWNYRAGMWSKCMMPSVNAVNTQDRTLTAYVRTFSSDGIGGE